MKKLLYLFILLPVLLTACWKEEGIEEIGGAYPIEIEAEGITLTQDSIGKYSFQWTEDTISFTLTSKRGELFIRSICYNEEPPKYDVKGEFSYHGLSIIEDEIIPDRLNYKLASQSKGSFQILLMTYTMMGYAYLTIKP